MKVYFNGMDLILLGLAAICGLIILGCYLADQLRARFPRHKKK